MTQDIPSTATFANAFVYNTTYQRRDSKDNTLKDCESIGYGFGVRIFSECLAEQKAVIEHEKYGRKGESGKLVGS